MEKHNLGTYDREKTKESIEKEISDYRSTLQGSEKQFFDNVPTLYRYQVVKSKKRLLSPREAIRLNCIHCCGWSLKGAMLCTAKMCPMFAYKPKPKPKEKAD